MHDELTPPGDDETRAQSGQTDDDAASEQRSIDSALEHRRRKVELLRGTSERREFATSEMECRTLDDGTIRMSGYASVTEHPYDIGDVQRGGFREVIARSAFKRTLSESPDVVLLANHGEGGSLPLARTKNGSLTLVEDARGLRWQADLDPEDPDSKVIARKVDQGLLDECSFAFRCTDDVWNEDFTQRTIKSLSLHKGDVSVVNYGANSATSVSVLRSTDGSVELRAGKSISSANEEALKRVLDLVATADDAVDRAQPILAEVLGVQNPDADDQAADQGDDRGNVVELEPRKPFVMPDHLSARRARLAVLKGGRR